MNELKKVLKSYCNKTLLDEDGDNLIIELNEGVDKEVIVRFEADNGIELPKDLKELLLFSNGLNLYGLQIFSIAEMEFFPNAKMLSFHSWGNGDFDCISVGADYPEGAVVFMSHNEDNTALVSSHLIVWFKEVISEISKLGTLLHPLDYDERESEGMYKNVSHQIDYNGLMVKQ